MSSSVTPTTTRLWASWATVEAKAPARRPKPRTRPRPTRPVAWWRSMTAILARSRAGSATTRPSLTGGASSRACVMSWPGIVSITRTRSAAGIAKASAGSGAERMVLRTRSGIGGRSNGSARPADGHQPSVLVHARGREGLELVEQHEVGAHAGRHGAAVHQAVAARGVQGGHQQRRLRRAALLDGHAAHLVDVPVAEQEVGLAVVGAEGAVLGPVLADQRQQVAQVARVRRLAQQHPHAAAALLQRLVERRRLVVGADAGGDVGVQRPADHAGRVAVGMRGAGHAQPRQHVGRAGDDAGEVHHLGHAERPRVAQDRLHVGRLERAHGRLEVARRHARRRHHEHVERQALGRLEHPLDALAAEHVRDLVRIGDHRRGAVRNHAAGELGGRQLRRLDVHVRVDEARAPGTGRARRPARRRRIRRARRSGRRTIATSTSSHSRVNTEQHTSRARRSDLSATTQGV